ncbi:MAG: SAM-dependent methyltransferase [Inhella sp.]|jgi:16S rRNA (cytidine1402-2'-O)-methyltransferase|uniref:SAM-dependent methyltransferase n=1 Tax=Inhella sp. TaxID=1921806 RepID=UPI0022CA6326|nr:SAM-dependent methyltransferase [Inhella sp.]MCZ8234601.1 SAM-dependent methyltransferase [Inhella sp.]
MSRPRLLLVPAPLDFGLDASAPLDEVLPKRTLQEAAGLQHWVVENAKTARALLKRVDAVIPLALPLQQLAIVELPRPPKGQARTSVDLSPLMSPLRAGHDLGLLSEAGLPAVADPGAALVAAAHRAGFAVHGLPGSSSIVQALAASGLNGQSFAFHGYAPTESTARLQRLREWEAQSRKLQQTQVLIETPYRNPALLQALVQALQPSTVLAVSRALTTPQEWTRSATVAQWRQQPSELPTDQPAMFSWLAAASG